MPTKAQMAVTIEQLASQVDTYRREFLKLNERLLSQLGDSLEHREPKILLVDDEDSIMEVLTLGLTRHFSPKIPPILTAMDGDCALRIIATERPLGICTDIAHPGPDGIELIKHGAVYNPLAVLGLFHGYNDPPQELPDFEIYKPCTLPVFTGAISTAYRIMYQRAKQQLHLCAQLHTTPDALTPIHESVRPVPKAGTPEHNLAMLLDPFHASFPNTFNMVLEEEYRRAGIPKEYRPHDFMEPIINLDGTSAGQKPLIMALARAYQHLLLTSDEFGQYRPGYKPEKSNGAKP